jgi:hypothetical protein
VTDAPSLAGELVEGRYRIDRAIGSGGFGTVYEAWHLTLDTRVALKILTVPPTWTPERRMDRFGMFLEEARTLAKLKHPNIVTALDAGILRSERLAEPVPYLVMAWCGRGSLGDLLAVRGALAPREAAGLIGPVVEAIAFAHAGGVVHRDLKPSNVMFEEVAPGNVVPRVIDFGIAKLVMPEEHAGDGETLTVSSSRMFTPAYAAPEQVAGAKTGPWTDVHALGLILSEMLVGRRVYEGADARMGAIDPDRPTPRKMGVDVGPLEPVLARALALRPGDRFRDARELASALDHAWRLLLGGAAPARIEVPPAVVTPAPMARAGAPAGWGATSITVPPASRTLETDVSGTAGPRTERMLPAPTRISRRLVVGGGLVAGTLAGVAGAIGLSRAWYDASAGPNEEREEEPDPPPSKRRVRDLTKADLIALATGAGFGIGDVHQNDDGATFMGVAHPVGSLEFSALQHFPKFVEDEARMLVDFGRFLLEIRRAWWTTQAYVIDGRAALVLLTRAEKTVAAFDPLVKGLTFSHRGDTIGGGDPAADAAGTRVTPWAAKGIADLSADEVASRLRTVDVFTVQGPLGDAGPLPLFFHVGRGEERGDVTLHRHGGKEALAERKRKKERFAFARQGEALFVVSGSGRLASPDLLAQILKGLDVKIESEPPF